MTFRERYMAGEAEFDEIFDLTNQWMVGDDTCTLAHYLGLNADEEDIWITESDEALEIYMEKEKSRKALFTDLDQTLLNENKEITPLTRAALKTMLENGHYVVLSTGRVLPSAMRVAARLDLDGKGCYIICCNGSAIYDLGNKKILHQQVLSPDVMEEACALARDFGIYIQGYSDTAVLTTQQSEHLTAYCRIQDLPYEIVPSIPEANPINCPKLLAIDTDLVKANAFRQLAKEKLSGKVDVFMSTPSYVEIVPLGVNKGSALERLCHYLGIPISQSESAGDEENDLTMIRAAGTGCAMANAINSVKEAANYITTADCNHDGVAEIIEKFILN